MNGPIVQACALAVFANQALRLGEPPGIWPVATVFQFCKRVTFGDVDVANGTGPEFAPDPDAWMMRLATQRVDGVRLLHQAANDPKTADRMLAGFIGGGGRWFLETRLKGHVDLWEAAWRVVDRNDPERKIWEVVYRRVLKEQPAIDVAAPTLADIHQKLTEVLNQIAAFAEQQELDAFATAFHRAEALLADNAPLGNTYHSDLAQCRVLNREAQQLLAAAQAAWVFGGMGSWNDQGFAGADQVRYDELSEHLYQALIASIVVATDSTLTTAVSLAPSAAFTGAPPPVFLPAPRPVVPPVRDPPKWWARWLGRR